MSLLKLISIYKKNPRISPVDITIFLRQFATLINAGISITHSCDILEKSEKNSSLRLLIYTIKRDILAGNTLFNCVRKHPLYFDQLTCYLIQIGEHTGKIDTILIALANHHEKKQALQQQIRRALFYPCIITITAILITFSMFLFVIPQFAELFQGTQTTLPLITRCIFYLSTLLQQCLWPFLLMIFIFVMLMLHTRYANLLKKYLHLLLFKLPIIHAHLHKVALTQFARHLALTLQSGIIITDALKLTANASNNTELTHTILQLRSKISSGLQLHLAMEAASTFPILMIQMIKIGEESGTIEYMLDKIADFFESDINHVISLANQLLEPLIMVILGVLIGGLVIGMYLPIFKLGSTL